MKKKTMVRKTLVMLLALCMVFTTAAGAFAASASSFNDIKGHWAYDYIDDCMNQGLFSGTSDTTFSPETNMTRGMFVTVLSRMDRATVNNNTASKFSDVPTGEYYTGAVNWAVNNKIVAGIDENTFQPDAPITREQMASLITRYATYARVTLKTTNNAVTFSDNASIADYAKDAVKSCQMAGLINGMGDGSFAPKANATRAQVAVIASKLGIIKNGSSSSAITVDFELNNKDAKGKPEDQILYSGALVAKPSDPTATNGTFKGWYTTKTGNKKWDFNDNVYQSMTLYAQWDTGNSGGNGGDNGSNGYSVDFNFGSDIKEVRADGRGTNNIIRDGKKFESQNNNKEFTFYVLLDDTDRYPRVKVDNKPIQYSEVTKITVSGVEVDYYKYTFKVTRSSSVTIGSSKHLAEGAYGDQAVVTEKADATDDITINLPIEEMKDSGKATFTIYFDEKVEKVEVEPVATATGNLAKYVKEAKKISGNERGVTITLDLSDAGFNVADFNQYRGVQDIQVTVGTGADEKVYNINIYAAAIFNIDVDKDVYEFTIHEDVPDKGTGEFGKKHGSYSAVGTSTELAYVDFTLLYAKSKEEIPTMTITAREDVDTSYEYVTYGDAQITDDPTNPVAATEVQLRTENEVKSYIYNIKVGTTKTAKVEYTGAVVGADQYDKFIYAYLPVDTLLEGGSFTVTLPDNITASDEVNTVTKDAIDVTYSGKVATIAMDKGTTTVTSADFDSAAWITPDVKLVTAKGTYYVSIHASAIWNIEVEGATDDSTVTAKFDGVVAKEFTEDGVANWTSELDEVLTIEVEAATGYEAVVIVNGDTDNPALEVAEGTTGTYAPTPITSSVYKVLVKISEKE